MVLRFFNKKYLKTNKFEASQLIKQEKEEIKVVKEKTTEDVSNKKNKKTKNSDNMNFDSKIKQAEETITSMEPVVKVVKTDKGLIERTESSKIVLTEDNRQLLVD